METQPQARLNNAPVLRFSTLKYDVSLIKRYHKALETSIEIATAYNIAPISGRTLVLCNAGSTMFRPCISARGLGAPRQVGASTGGHIR